MNKLEETIKNPKSYKKELYKAFKNIFSDTIKQSFLIDMIEKVESDERFLYLFMRDSSNLSFESVIVGQNFDPSRLCKMIIMNHYFNTLSISDYERGSKQTSSEYKNNLAQQVINMYSIKNLATSDFATTALEAYLPIIYHCAALNNFLGYKYEELKSSKAAGIGCYDYDYNYKTLHKIILKIKACVNLADLRATDELTVVFRSLIEIFMTYATLWDKRGEVIRKFYEFDKASFEYNNNGNINEGFRKKAKELEIKKINYLNHGWMLELDEVKKLSDYKKNLNIKGLSLILDNKCSYFCPNFGTELYKLYKACNPQTHGTTLVMNYFQLELHIFQNIAVMLKFITEVMSQHLFIFTIEYNNVDLIDELNRALNDCRAVYNRMYLSDIALSKTNQDYYERAKCVIKMKGNMYL